MNGHGLRYQTWFRRGRPRGALADLLPAAAEALLAEDRQLQQLMRTSPRSETAPPRNNGIGYGLFETTLVHLMFKAWLPLADVDVEVSYPGRRASRADLVVSDRQLYFEAKWWGSMQRATIDAIAADVDRLASVPGAAGRYLLLFWWSYVKDEVLDWNQVEGIETALGRAGVRPIYYADFLTHMHSGDAFFAFLTVHVPGELSS